MKEGVRSLQSLKYLLFGPLLKKIVKPCSTSVTAHFSNFHLPKYLFLLFFALVGLRPLKLPLTVILGIWESNWKKNLLVIINNTAVDIFMSWNFSNFRLISLDYSPRLRKQNKEFWYCWKLSIPIRNTSINTYYMTMKNQVQLVHSCYKHPKSNNQDFTDHPQMQVIVLKVA